MTANALAWLNDLMQWLGRWIPRLVLLHATHRGVLFGPRGGTKLVGPGLVFYWPITHDLVEVAVTMQSIQLVSQMMPMADNASAAKLRCPQVKFVTLNVQFSIADPVKAATKVLYFHALVSNKASSCAMKEWLKSDRGADQGWLEKAREALTVELAAFGITLETLELAGIGPGLAMKQMSDWAWNEERTGTRPKD